MSSVGTDYVACYERSEREIVYACYMVGKYRNVMKFAFAVLFLRSETWEERRAKLSTCPEDKND
jgi:hypothetical protein